MLLSSVTDVLDQDFPKEGTKLSFRGSILLHDLLYTHIFNNNNNTNNDHAYIVLTIRTLQLFPCLGQRE